MVNVDNGVDYRLRALEQAELYHYPLDCDAYGSLKRSFDSLVPDINEVVEAEELIIENRPIKSVRVCEDVAWFEFRELCDGPRRAAPDLRPAGRGRKGLLARLFQRWAHKL